MNARCSQELKNLLHKYIELQGPDISPTQLEALDMICLKLSRIVTGRAMFRDHWKDIAGYAGLAAEACND